jgi:DNA-binding transcriptional LysR family regulator
MTLEVAQLRAFQAVVQHGSFSRAATALGYTQPAMSHHIARLERHLGVQLIERVPPRSLRLTTPGRALLRHAEAVLSQLAAAEREIRAIGSLKAGSLAMAAFPTAAATFVPTAVGIFRDKYPDVTIEISEQEPSGSIPQLAAGTFDLALAYDYPGVVPQTDPRIHTEVLFSDPMAVVLPAGHPLADTDTVRVSHLADEQWVLPNESGCRTAILHVCRNAGFTPQIATQTSDYMAMLGLVAAQVGIALVPWLVAAIRVHPDTILRPLDEPALTRVVGIATRADGYHSPGTEVMSGILRDVISALAVGLPLATNRRSNAGRASAFIPNQRSAHTTACLQVEPQDERGHPAQRPQPAAAAKVPG